MEEARGVIEYRRIPAFGEWNYDHGGGDDWSVLSQRFESAMETPFPLHKPCKRPSARRRRIPAFGEWNKNNNSHGDHGWIAAVNQCFEPETAHKSHKQLQVRRVDGGVIPMGEQHKLMQTWVADSGPQGAMKPFTFTVVKAADDDLYEVPPDMPCGKPIQKGRTWLKRMLMKWFGLHCFAR